MKKLFQLLTVSFFMYLSASAQKGLIISEFLANPSGDDASNEYVELLATMDINFAQTPYTVVFCSNGSATANGWIEGGDISYGFLINSGTVTKGQVVYVGGSSMAPLSNGGVAIRKIDTKNKGGDSFGSKNSDGVLGDGGDNCDGIAVFNTAVTSITASTVPVDAIFFGDDQGDAVKSSSKGYQLPVNDAYNGGKLSSSSYIAPDPGSGDLIVATAGAFDATAQNFTTKRTWTKTTTKSYNKTSVTLAGTTTGGSGGTGSGGGTTGGGTTANTAPTVKLNPATTNLVNVVSGKISCVMGDATDQVTVYGLGLLVSDESLSTLSFKMTSSSTSVVGNNNFTVTGSTQDRRFIITPSAAGYTTITLKVTDNGGLSNQLSFQLAVSKTIATKSISNVYHTGMGDASATVAIDSNYMFVADDETSIIGLYNRKVSGLPIYTFDPTPFLKLSTTEVDIESCFMSATNPKRIYWLGSLGNSKTGELRPDRNRLFATDIVGSGANATLTFVGYYDDLRSKIISWGDSYGYKFSTKAAAGMIPKRIDGFNIEGFVMGADGTTAYVGFRAPFVPDATKDHALICPIKNFETWFNNGKPSGAPTFGAPIELKLNTKGIRSLDKNKNNQFIITAGSYDTGGTFQLFSWDGKPTTTAPVALTADLTGISPESIAEVPASVSGSFVLQLVSDNGTVELYNDGVENKDITELNYRKFISSYVAVTAPLASRPAAETEINTNPEISVYPNPATSNLTIQYNTNGATPTTYYIYDTKGSLVKEITGVIAGNNTTVNISSLQSGVYIITASGLKQGVIINKQ